MRFPHSAVCAVLCALVSRVRLAAREAEVYGIYSWGESQKMSTGWVLFLQQINSSIPEKLLGTLRIII